MKFNVDGSAIGKPGKVGIGRVLCDDTKAVKLVFSKSIWVANSNLVELMVVMEAFMIFVASS
ncbi:hypothetical protein REPUB_Repub04eG0133600 [Reevesia pubescens]